MPRLHSRNTLTAGRRCRLTLARALLLSTCLLVSPFGFSETNVAELDWLVGQWRGDGFGGSSEETWSPAKDGVMMGMFRHHKADGSINFYEFMLISKEGLKLKHFNPDMTGWEEKQDYLHFRFTSQTATRVVFGGLSFEKIDPDHLKVSLKMHDNGSVRTEVFNYVRAR